MRNDKKTIGDIKKNGTSWIYSETVKKHFFNPCNFVKGAKPAWKYNGYGESGSAACGDVMKVWLYIDSKTLRIKKFGWKTFGCASAIATTSILSEMVAKGRGMHIDQAYKISPLDIIKKLGGLPPKKVHCSILGDQALQEAIDDFKKSQDTDEPS
jgi:NifU-like protein involved in Fe-S cluster formation